MADERLEVEITLDDGSIRKGFARLENRGNKASEELNTSFSRTTSAIRTQLLALGGTLAAAFSVRALAGTVKEFGDFEQALIGVQKTTDLANDQIQLFGADIQKLSTEIPVAAEELLKLAQQAGQFGISDRSGLLVFTETVAKLGFAIDGIDVNQAAEGLVRILNIAGESTDEIKTLSTVIVNLGNNLAATEGDIVTASLEISRATAGFGFASNEVASLGAALSALGVRAESGGTAIGKTLRGIDSAINNSTKELDDFARIAGKSVDDFVKLFREDANETFNLFIKGLSDISKQGGNVSKILTDLGLNNERVLKTLLPLATGYDQLETALSLTNQELEDGNALENEAERAFSTLNSEITKLSGAFNRLKVAIGTAGSGPLSAFIRITKEAAISTSRFFESFRGDAVGELRRVEDEIAKIEERIESASKLGGGSGFLGFDVGDINKVDQLKKELEELRAKRDQIAVQAEKIIESEKGVTDVIKDQGDKTKEVINSSIEFGEVTKQLFKEFNTETQEGLKAFNKVVAAETKQIANLFSQTIGGGVSQAFASFGRAVATGQNGLEALGDSVLQTLGSLATQLGQFFILVGTGMSATGALLGLSGGAAIAAGIALSVLGGALSAIGGGGSEATGAGGSNGVIGDDEPPALEDEEDLEPGNQVSVNIQGDVLDSDESGLRIAKLLQEELDKSGNSILQVT